jgi:hypothetical protein
MDGRQQIDRARILSIHSAGIAEAIALAAALGRLPRHVVLYGIEPGLTEPFAGTSDAVRNSIDNLIQELATAPSRDASPAQRRLDDALRRLGGAVSLICPGELDKASDLRIPFERLSGARAPPARSPLPGRSSSSWLRHCPKRQDRHRRNVDPQGLSSRTRTRSFGTGCRSRKAALRSMSGTAWATG